MSTAGESWPQTLDCFEEPMNVGAAAPHIGSSFGPIEGRTVLRAS